MLVLDRTSTASLIAVTSAPAAVGDPLACTPACLHIAAAGRTGCARQLIWRCHARLYPRAVIGFLVALICRATQAGATSAARTSAAPAITKVTHRRV